MCDDKHLQHKLAAYIQAVPILRAQVTDLFCPVVFTEEEISRIRSWPVANSSAAQTFGDMFDALFLEMWRPQKDTVCIGAVAKVMQKTYEACQRDLTPLDPGLVNQLKESMIPVLQQHYAKRKTGRYRKRSVI